MELQKILNEQQRKAVESIKGPQLILAGAGSGKTRVLTYRIAYLIKEIGVNPGNVLAITFTNKASKEMKERIEKLVGVLSQYIWVSTFHSCCVRILRRDIDKIGYERNFVIYDDIDKLSVIKDCIRQLNVDEEKFDAKQMKYYISNKKDNLQTFEDVDKQDYALKIKAEIYKLYEKKLKNNNALDFDDLILKTIELLDKNSDVLEYYQDKFQYIHIDEYQDTNHAQYMLVNKLAAKYKNLCVVGDDDQSIYRFRGADIRNILDFEKDYPKAGIIKLEQNYRSTKTILDAANCIINNNCNRKKKKLWTQNQDGEKINIYQAHSGKDEAEFICGEIYKLTYDQRYSYKDFALLYRTNAQSRIIEESLVRRGIPYKVLSGVGFYHRKEIKDIHAYLRLIANTRDDTGLKRIINTPKRGIGDRTVSIMEEYAAINQISLFDVVMRVREIDILNPRAVNSVMRFKECIDSIMEIKDTMKVSEFIYKVLHIIGYFKELDKEDVEIAQSRKENLMEFMAVAEEYEKENGELTLEGFLEHIALISDVDKLNDMDDSVTLMTVHSAKGLEFPVVFLGGMEEGIFPHQRSLNDNEELQEERRLCYVAITRAKELLYMTYASMRNTYGSLSYKQVSSFIQDINEELIELKGTGDNYTSGLLGTDNGGIFNRRASFNKDNNMAATIKYNPSGNNNYNLGCKVLHKSFGQGTVVGIKGEGENTELSVAFPEKGIKLLVVKYAPIEII